VAADVDGLALGVQQLFVDPVGVAGAFSFSQNTASARVDHSISAIRDLLFRDCVSVTGVDAGEVLAKFAPAGKFLRSQFVPQALAR
jgi:hypothetical protein